MTAKFSTLLRACALLIVLPSLAAHATTNTYLWTNMAGGTGALWATGTNWNLGNPPGTTQPFDDAYIFNTGTATTTITTPIAGVTVDLLDITLGSTALGGITTNGTLNFNIAGNFTTTNNGGVTGETADSFISTHGILNVNVENGATFTTGSSTGDIPFTFQGSSGSTFTILSGGTVLSPGTAAGNSIGSLLAGDSLVVSGNLYQDSSSAAIGTSSFYPVVQNTGLYLKTASALTINTGGVAILNGIFSGANTATGASGTTGSAVNIVGGSLTVRYNGQGIAMTAAGIASNYTLPITEANPGTGGGVVLNNAPLNLGLIEGAENTSGSSFYQPVATMAVGSTTTGGTDTWTQNGLTSVGQASVGILAVNNTGVFNTRDVYVGGGGVPDFGSAPANPTLYGKNLVTSDSVSISGVSGASFSSSVLTASGTLVLNGGTMDVTNPTAGTSFTSTSVGSGSSGFVPPSSAAIPYDGERIQFSHFTGTGSTLNTSTVYYVVTGAATDEFKVSLTPGGTPISLTGYTGATYSTEGAVLAIGSSIAASTSTTTVVPGTLTLNSGTMSVDELDTNITATNATSPGTNYILNGNNGLAEPTPATINFNGGTLILAASNPSNSNLLASNAADQYGALPAVTVGNSTSAASLQFAGGTASVPQALATNINLNTNSSFRGFGVTSATLTPIGTASGSLTSAGLYPNATIISPGTVKGTGNILVAPSINAVTNGLSFQFQFNATTPTYTNLGNSGNDVLYLTSATPISANLTSTNVFDIYLNVASLSLGTTYQGGIFDASGNLNSLVSGATYDYFVLGNGSGSSTTYDGQGYYSLLAYNTANSAAFTVTSSVVGATANFGNGVGLVTSGAGGEVQEFTIGSSVYTVAYFNGLSSNMNLGTNYDSSVSSGSSAGGALGSGTNVFYSANRNASQNSSVITGAPLVVNSINFGVGTGTNSNITISSDNNTTDNLTIDAANVNGNTGNNGISIASGAGNDTISAPVVLGASQTWTTTNASPTNTSTLTVSGQVSDGGGNFALTKAGTGSVILSSSTGNTYGGGTTVSGGTLYVNSGVTGVTPTSGTGSGAVSVTSGGTLAGSGNITTSGGISIGAGATLASGDAQTSHPSVDGTHLTVTNTHVSVSGTGAGSLSANLTFALGTGSDHLGTGSTGAYNFAKPITDTTSLTLATGSTLSFTGTDSVSLVDETTGSLSLRNGTPYLLVAAASGSDASYSGLITETGSGANTVYTVVNGTNGNSVNGYVVGVLESSYSGGNALNAPVLGTDYTTIAINQFGPDGATALTGANIYAAPVLYLYNGDLEVVPEPGTWALMLGGLALLMFINRAKSKNRNG